VVTNSRRLIVVFFVVFRIFDPKDEVGRENSKRTKCAPFHDLQIEVHIYVNGQILKKFALEMSEFSKQ
jgi:hypothetical protein